MVDSLAYPEPDDDEDAVYPRYDLLLDYWRSDPMRKMKPPPRELVERARLAKPTPPEELGLQRFPDDRPSDDEISACVEFIDANCTYPKNAKTWKVRDWLCGVCGRAD